MQQKNKSKYLWVMEMFSILIVVVLHEFVKIHQISHFK